MVTYIMAAYWDGSAPLGLRSRTHELNTKTRMTYNLSYENVCLLLLIVIFSAFINPKIICLVFLARRAC